MELQVQAPLPRGGGAGLPSNRCLVCVPGLLAVAGALGRRQDPIGRSRPWTWPSTKDGASPSDSPARFPTCREVRSPSPKTHPLSDSGPLELSPGAAEPSLCDALEVRVSPAGFHALLPLRASLLPSPPPPLASEHHLSLQPASATPACLLPGKPPPWQPAGIHMTRTRGKGRFLPPA